MQKNENGQNIINFLVDNLLLNQNSIWKNFALIVSKSSEEPKFSKTFQIVWFFYCKNELLYVFWGLYV